MAEGGNQNHPCPVSQEDPPRWLSSETCRSQPHAFRAPSREAVDELYRNYLLPKKIPTLYRGPKEWKDYDLGYYAVYFEDPDRIKLELVYVPGDL